MLNPEPDGQLPGTGNQLSIDRHREAPRTLLPGQSSLLEKVKRLVTTDWVTETPSMHTSEWGGSSPKADKQPETHRAVVGPDRILDIG